VRLNDIPPGVSNQRYGQIWTVISVKNSVSEYIDLGQRRIPLRRTSLGGSGGTSIAEYVVERQRNPLEPGRVCYIMPDCGMSYH